MEWHEELIEAATAGGVERLRELLAVMPEDEGALDRRGDKGQTALMTASWRGRISACELLLAAGADPSLRDHFGKTAHAFASRSAAGRVSREEARAGRGLFASCGKGGPVPRRFRVNFIDREGRGERTLRRLQGRASDELAKSLGVRIWLTPGTTSGTIWLLPAEEGRALEVMRAAAGAAVPVELELNEDPR